MIQVRYIGRKPIKTDNVAHSGAVWVGTDDVQAVTDEVWAKLQPFDTVWQKVEADAPAAKAEEPAKEEAPQPEDKPEEPASSSQQTPDPLEGKSVDEMHAYATERGLNIDRRLRNADRIRAAIEAAQPAG